MTDLSWLIISIAALVVGFGAGYLIAQLGYCDDEDDRD